MRLRVFRCVETKLEFRGLRLGVNSSVTLSRSLKSSPVCSLDLYGNFLRDVGTMAILQLVRGNPAITRLNLGCNDIGIDGALAIANELRTNDTLRVLELGALDSHWADNQFDSVGALAIAKALLRNESLFFLGLNNTLLFRSANRDAAELFGRMLSENIGLTHLKIGSNQLGNLGGMSFLDMAKQSSSLYALDLSSSLFGPEMGASLADFIMAVPTLTILYLQHNELSFFAVEHISEALRVSNLVVMDLENVDMSDRGAQALATALQDNIHLTSLNLCDNGLTSQSCTSLARMLKYNATLASIKLSKNPLRDEGAVLLAAALSVNDALFRIDMHSCKIGDAGFLSLCQHCGKSLTLKQLGLRDNFISSESGKAGFEAIQENHSLTRMDLRGNRIELTIVNNIKKILQRNGAESKQVEPNRLRDELYRLQHEQAKLKDAENALQAVLEKQQKSGIILSSFEAELAAIKTEEESKIRRLLEKIQEEKLKSDILAADVEKKQREFEEMTAEYDERFAELESGIAVESKTRADVEEEIAKVESETERLRSTREERVQSLKDDIKKTHAEKILLTKQSVELRQELERLRLSHNLKPSTGSPMVSPMSVKSPKKTVSRKP